MQFKIADPIRSQTRHRPLRKRKPRRCGSVYRLANGIMEEINSDNRRFSGERSSPTVVIYRLLLVVAAAVDVATVAAG